MEFIESYSEKFTLYRYECDFLGRALPGAVLRFAQQIATDHCNCFGLNDEVYSRTGTAFLLAKTALEFTRIPRQDEVLDVLTHPENMRHATFKRLTWLRDEAGETVAFADSRWVLVDIASRRILRELPPEFRYNWTQDVPGELKQKIVKPKQAEDLGLRRAEYTLCDTNGHLNNTRYADIACNALPTELLAEHPVRRMNIHYHREIPMGSSFTLQRAQTGPDCWYFAGRQGEASSFEVQAELF